MSESSPEQNSSRNGRKESLSIYEERFPRSPYETTKGEGPLVWLHLILKEFDQVPAEHRVPVRFGMSGMVGLLTLMSVIFAFMRSLEAPIAMYVYVSVQTLAICLLQMRFNDAVRGASMLVGAIWLPLFLFLLEIYYGSDIVVPSLIGLPCLLVSGAFCGYFNGAIAAGLFLVLSGFESKHEPPIVAELVDPEPLQGEKHEP